MKYCISNQTKINDSPNRKGIAGGGKQDVVFVTDTTNSLSVYSSGTSNAIDGYNGQNRYAVEDGKSFFIVNINLPCVGQDVKIFSLIWFLFCWKRQLGQIDSYIWILPDHNSGFICAGEGFV